MENSKDYLSTYRFFDDRGRRLSIFARPATDDAGKEYLHAYVITCSKKDTFSKSRAKGIFEGRSKKIENTRGEEFRINIIDKKPKWSFINWCKDKYFKLEKATVTTQAMVLTGRMPDSDVILWSLPNLDHADVKLARDGVQTVS
jgi:hypothetical protein